MMVMRILIDRYSLRKVFFPIAISAGMASAYAQVDAEVVVPGEEAGSLQAVPKEDLFRIANMLYDQAMAEKNDALEKQRMLQLAATRYAEYRKKYPGEALAQQAMYREALCMMALDRKRDAQGLFSELSSQYKTGPFVAASAYQLATMNFEAKSYQRALDYFSLSAKESDKPELKLSALYGAAQCYLKLNRKSDAAAAFSAVADAKEATPWLRNSSRMAVAALDVEANKLDAALGAYEKVITSSDADAKSKGTAYLLGASVAARAGKHDVARKYYSDVIKNERLKDFIPQAQVGLMEILYKQKQYDEVLREMRRNAAPIDKVLDTRRALLAGESALRVKKYNDAISYFARVETLSPGTELAMESAYRRILCSQELSLPNQEQTMKTFMETYANRFPNSSYIHMVRLAQADALSLSDRGKAAQLFKLVDVSKLPVEMRANFLYKQAWILSEVNDRVGALRALDDFVTQYPTDKRMPEALALRGEMYMHTNDEVGALSDFNRLIREFPQSEMAAVAWQRAAQLYAEKQDTANMIKFYEGLIKNFPKAKPASIAEANYMIGKGYFDLKQYDKAVSYLEEARTLRPDRYRDPVNNYLVYSFYELRDTDKLKTVYNRLRNENYQAAKALPEAVPAWLGAQCFAMKDYKGADSYLTMAADIVEPQRTKPIIWSTLAKARIHIGKFDRALTAVDNYLAGEEAPGRRAQGLLDKSVALARLKKWDEAQAAAEEAVKIGVEGPLRATLNIILGDIAYAREEYEEAARLYGTTASLFTSDRELKPQALYKAAVSLEKAGKKEEARQFADDLKKEYPQWKPANDIFEPMI